MEFAWFLSFVLFLFFFLLSKRQRGPECGSDVDCLGELSTCVTGICHCVPQLFHPFYRCDENSREGVDPFVVLYLLCTGVFWTLGFVVVARMDRTEEEVTLK